MIIHNERIRELIRDKYKPEDVQNLRALLDHGGTFDFPVLPTGLFPAAHLSERGQYTGYDSCWIRDNIHIAHAHYVAGQTDVAVRNAEVLLSYFGKYRQRFETILDGAADPAIAMNRPHVRFDGSKLEEIDENWSHAQNDALGYFLWFYCKLALAGKIAMNAQTWETLALLPLFFAKVRYWEDEDSGHWEEARKIEASSIGAVYAALKMLRTLMAEPMVARLADADHRVTFDLLNDLIQRGRVALEAILPAESVQAGHERPYDSALLFLIYPLEIFDGADTPDAALGIAAAKADAILLNVEKHLQGEYGIRRYLGDSFWCANYDKLVAQDQRTTDFSQDMTARDALVRQGEEAQWCIFDPILSTIYGKRFEATGNEVHLARQTHYFNRSLGQLTSNDSGFRELACPELYYLSGDCYVPNDVTPLLWTQANLLIALGQVEKNAARV